MRKLKYLLREMGRLIKKHKVYFLAPLFFLLIVVALVCFYIGPSVVIAFIYAGI